MKIKTLSRYETSRIEYKEAGQGISRNTYKAISAFANTKGGAIVFGIKQDNNKIVKVGVNNPQKIVDDFVSTVSSIYNICPMVKPEIVKERNKYFVIAEVEQALYNEKPIYMQDAGPIKGGFKRVGSSNIHLNDADLQRFYQSRMHSPDAYVIKETTISDISSRAVSFFKNLREFKTKDKKWSRAKTKDILKAYHLLSSDGKHLTVAGLLLFGKTHTIKRYFSHFRVDIIRIKGTEWGKERDPFLSNDIQGSILEIRDLVIDNISKFLFTQFKLDEKRLNRIDDDPYKRALREALSNLLMHQNYFHRSPSQIRIYNDRIEFYNPGHSLKNPKEFKDPGSEFRNILIPPVFYDIGWAETKGTGYRDNILVLKQEGYPKPKWNNNEESDTFTIIFPYNMDYVVNKPIDQAGPKLGPSWDQVGTKLGLSQNDLIGILKFCNEYKSIIELMKNMRKSNRTKFRNKYINPLLSENLLNMLYPDKPKSSKQKYIMTEKGKDILKSFL